MTASTPLPISCPHRCSRLLLQKTFDGSFLSRIKQGSPWKMRTRFSSPTTGNRWTKRLHRCMPSQKSKIYPIWNNSKTLRLSDISKGNKTGRNRTSTTGATTDHVDKATKQTSTTTTARTPISPNPILLGMVNSVSIVKS
jgi:hypothetical protein